MRIAEFKEDKPPSRFERFAIQAICWLIWLEITLVVAAAAFCFVLFLKWVKALLWT